MAKLGVIWADGIWNTAIWNTGIWAQEVDESDTTPDAFSFTDQTNVPLSSTRTSNSITIAGINEPVSISITGGEYSINGGVFSSIPSINAVNNGDQIRARHTSSGAFSTAVNTVVTIGGVSDTFTSTTVASVTVPDVVGDAEADARTEAEGAGLVVSVVPVYSDDVEAGIVIDQLPTASSHVAPGSVLTLSVSLGVRDVGQGYGRRMYGRTNRSPRLDYWRS